MRWDRLDWTALAYFRDKRRAVVNTVMNLRVQQNAGNVVVEALSVSQQGLCSVELVG
jgi:hypothetical protein